MKKSSESGFSVIELVVIVLIMGIVAGTAIMSMSRLFSSTASSCANLISANLERARIETMSRQDGAVYVKLYYDSSDECNYIEIEGAKQGPEMVARKNIGLSVIYDDGSTLSIDSANTAYIYFDKTTGVYIDGSGAGKMVKTIVVDGTGDYRVELVLDTGRNYVEKD